MLDSLADYLDIFADNFVHLGPTYIPYPKMRFVDVSGFFGTVTADFGVGFHFSFLPIFPIEVREFVRFACFSWCNHVRGFGLRWPF